VQLIAAESKNFLSSFEIENPTLGKAPPTNFLVMRFFKLSPNFSLFRAKRL
jgi:hypothetical protein